MKTKKLLAMSNFVETYRNMVSTAYNYYVGHIKYDLSLKNTTEEEKKRFALNALLAATRASEIYDCAFYAGIKGLPTNLLDIQKRECKRMNCLDDNVTMDDIVEQMYDYVHETFVDIEDL